MHKEKPREIKVTIYRYAKDSKRSYRVCKRIVKVHKLGTVENGKTWLSAEEVKILDSTKR